ncbi:MAG: tRNA preQ1(34) S-adenosylmethionine ribosyltransferase-isomerase QueA [Rhodobacteraceae bacterium]|nr:tRNA preQ1(34) S-adenosylmethionine ribosyltransferase-isomerase QueA [Paracoccaceae bacterium]
MHIDEFNYELPESHIALRPASPRSASRLLVATSDRIRDSVAINLGDHLQAGDRLVVNNVRVLPAHIEGFRVRRNARAGEINRARVSFTLDEVISGSTWRAMGRPLRRMKPGDLVEFSEDCTATIEGIWGQFCALTFDTGSRTVSEFLERHGTPPIPPYIATRRAVDPRDRTDYQTVFAQRDGAAAAPTASLHFDEELLARLRALGVEFTEVTLKVGSGTFAPIRCKNIDEHEMHPEWGEVPARAAAEINDTCAEGGRIIPVGTTAMRLIESAAASGGISPWEGSTGLYIRPGFEFRISSALLTNFHLPGSSLLVLVAAFVGLPRMRDIYRHAVESHYRFLSYGDWSLLFP